MKITPLFLTALLSFTLFFPIDVSAQPFAKNTNYSRQLRSVLSGGSANLIQTNSRFSFLGGGDTQILSGDNVTLAGGGINVAGPGRGATVGGGLYNEASGFCATVPGGLHGHAVDDYSFVWAADSSYEPTYSFGAETFTVRCEGGARFYTADGTGTGVRLEPGSGSWNNLSDRNAKENFEEVSPSEILVKVAAMPVKAWNYKMQDDSIRHIGPTAQDFKSAFGVGESDTGIATVDADGVAFAAIKGLVEELKDRDKAMAARDKTIGELKAKLQAVEERLSSLPPAP